MDIKTDRHEGNPHIMGKQTDRQTDRQTDSQSDRQFKQTNEINNKHDFESRLIEY